MSKEFGERLKEEIEFVNISVNILEEEIGVPKNTIYHWCDNTAQPYLQNIIKIADYFNCSVDYLVDREQTKYENIVFKKCPLFSEQLRKYMTETNTKSVMLCRSIGIDRKQIYRLTRNISEPQLNTLIKLADYFGTTIDIFIGRQ